MIVLAPKNLPVIEAEYEIEVNDTHLLISMLEEREDAKLTILKADPNILQMAEKLYVDTYYLVGYPEMGLYPTAKELGLTESTVVSYDEVINIITSIQKDRDIAQSNADVTQNFSEEENKI